jgi:hypothetical protein
VLARTCLVVLIALGVGLCPAQAIARTWNASETAVPACLGIAENELNCSLTQCAGYGLAGDWADEVQVRFCMPEASFGGPWLVQYVAFYMSGTGPHTVIVRSAGTASCSPGSAPGDIIDQTRSFTPVADSWPPSGWTIAQLGQGPPYTSSVLCAEGTDLCVGVHLAPGDRFGLSSQTGLDGTGWGFAQGSWSYDSQEWVLTPAIRIGLVDLGLSQTESSTWGQLKGLFR